MPTVLDQLTDDDAERMQGAMRRLREANDRTQRRAYRSQKRRPDGGSIEDMLGRMIDGKRLAPEQIRAAKILVDLISAQHGKSGGLVGGYGERQSSGGNVARMMPGEYATDAHTRFDRAVRHLHPNQRRLLNALITNRELKRGGFDGIAHQLYGIVDKERGRHEVFALVRQLLTSLDEYWHPHLIAARSIA